MRDDKQQPSFKSLMAFAVVSELYENGQWSMASVCDTASPACMMGELRIAMITCDDRFAQQVALPRMHYALPKTNGPESLIF